jgi:hypothetical protein
VKRSLGSSGALLWGLQFAFLNPALALLLVALFDATAAEVGWVGRHALGRGQHAGRLLLRLGRRAAARHLRHGGVRQPGDPARDRRGRAAQRRHDDRDARPAVAGGDGRATP